MYPHSSGPASLTHKLMAKPSASPFSPVSIATPRCATPCRGGSPERWWRIRASSWGIWRTTNWPQSGGAPHIARFAASLNDGRRPMKSTCRGSVRTWRASLASKGRSHGSGSCLPRHWRRLRAAGVVPAWTAFSPGRNAGGDVARRPHRANAIIARRGPCHQCCMGS